MTVTANLVLALMLLQYPVRRTGPRTATATASGANVDAVATFNGKFKSVGRKFLTIGVEDGETMQMYVTGKTKFVRDGKPAKASDFKEDEDVVVGASRDSHMNLLAVQVENAKPPAKAPEGTKIEAAKDAAAKEK